MTDLNSIVKRRTISNHSLARRRLVVMLMPGDVLGFKEERRREVITVPIHQIYTLASQWHAAAAKRKRKEERKLRRNGGIVL